MEFLSSIDWLTVLITVAGVIIAWNAVQVVRYTIIKKRADAEMKRIDEKIAKVQKDIESTKKAILEKLQKPPK